MVPEMVWVGGFSDLHTGSQSRTLRQRLWGTFPGHLIVGNPFLKDFHAQAIQRITKLFIFPPMIRKDDAGSRENPAILLVIIWGHTQTTGCVFTKGFFCFHGQQFTFQVLPKALCQCCSGQNLSYLLVYSGRVLRLGHTKSDWLKKYQMSKFIKSGQKLVFSWHLHELTPEKCLSFLGP